MARDLEEHNRILYEQFSTFDGIPFKNVGDGFMVAFRNSEVAIRCGLAIQAALSGLERVKVRVGIHSGIAQEIGGDYFGAAVNRASRVCGVAQGGQVVCSESAWHMGEEFLRPELDCTSLGSISLAGLVKPEVLVLVHQTGAPVVWESVEPKHLISQKNNFPSLDRHFVGRQHQLHLIKDELQNAQIRILTIVGFGGMGKSTLALQVAKELQELAAFPGGIRFVPCESLRELEEVRVAIENQLFAVCDEAIFPGLKRSGPILKQRTLMILDCFENVVRFGGLLSEFIEAEPHLQFLISSRVVLNVSGERTVELEPFPEVKNIVASDPNVKLFMQTAHSVDSGFSVSKESRGVFLKILRRLEGVPLAIVLTASRVRHLSLIDIHREFESGQFGIVRGSKSAFGKHSSLELVVEQSVSLLNREDFDVAVKVSAFAGGFHLQDARAVLGRDPDLIEKLSNLRDQSLLVGSIGSEGMRYRQLDSIREYLHQHFVSTIRAELMPKYASYYVEIARKVRLDYMAGNWQSASQVLIREVGNFRTAIEWAVEINDSDTLAQIVFSLARPYFESGMLEEFKDLVAMIAQFESLNDQSQLQIELLGLSGQRARREGKDLDAIQFWSRRADICLSEERIDDYIDSLLDIVDLQIERGEDSEVEVVMSQVRSFANQISTEQVRTTIQIFEARFLKKQGDQEGAREKVLELFRNSKLRRPDEQLFFVNLGVARLLREFGYFEESLIVIRDMLKFAVEGQFSSYCCSVLVEYAQTLEATGDVESAAKSLLTARTISKSASVRHLKKIHELLETLSQKVDISVNRGMVEDFLEDHWDLAVAHLVENRQ
jgi:predicted ATPase